MKFFLAIIVILCFTFSCIPDTGTDGGTEPLSEQLSQSEVDNMRHFVLNKFTNADSQVLNFIKATSLQPDFIFDIQDYENFLDDEFEFSVIENDFGGQLRGKLEWRPGLSVNPELVNEEELSIGTNVEPLTIEFTIGEPSSLNRTDEIRIELIYDETTLVSKNKHFEIGTKNNFGVGFPPFGVNFPSFGGVTFPSLEGGIEFPAFGGVKFVAYWPYTDPNVSVLELCSDVKPRNDGPAPVPDNPEGPYMVANVNGVNWIANERFLAGVQSFNNGAGTPTRYRRFISADFDGADIGEINAIYFYLTDRSEPHEFEVGEFTLESGLDSANICIKIDERSCSPRAARMNLDEAILNITAITGNIIEGNFSFTITESVNNNLTTTYTISDGLFKMEF